MSLLFVAIGIAVMWMWIARVPVTEKKVAMMVQRIAFPGGLKLADANLAVAQLTHPDEIVIPFEHATLVIDYPLTHPATVKLSASYPIGFTRAELVRAICDEYAAVYEAEEGTAHTKTVPPSERGEIRSRNRTDGAYGIWGHDLEDLALTAVRWSRKDDGTVMIELHVEG
ncbi:MAG TPA: hypothetical protein VFQ53_08820 [Kofleriaceae bacterium]|nr:hypothetical protein [Kofleriaceae bacterium]